VGLTSLAIHQLASNLRDPDRSVQAERVRGARIPLRMRERLNRMRVRDAYLGDRPAWVLGSSPSRSISCRSAALWPPSSCIGEDACIPATFYKAKGFASRLPP
jgi:hypothetical protein